MLHFYVQDLPIFAAMQRRTDSALHDFHCMISRGQDCAVVMKTLFFMFVCSDLHKRKLFLYFSDMNKVSYNRWSQIFGTQVYSDI
jgi:hypothetical protein